MDLRYIVAISMVIILAAATACVIYLLIYKKHINKILNHNSIKHRHLPAPYLIVGCLGLVCVIVLTTLISAGTGFISNKLKDENDIAEHAQEFQKIDSDFTIEVDSASAMAGVLAYDADHHQPIFSIYLNENNNNPNYKFRIGGKSTAVEQCVRVFKYRDEITIISMNNDHIAKIECHDVNSFDLDPNQPFVLTIPNGTISFYNVDGEEIDIAQGEWYEETIIPDNN